MTPKQVATARRIIGKPWYRKWRIWSIRNAFRQWDKALMHDLVPPVGECCRHMERLAQKEEWYMTRMEAERFARKWLRYDKGRKIKVTHG